MSIFPVTNSNIDFVTIRKLKKIFADKNWHLPNETEIKGLDEIEIEDIFPYQSIYNKFVRLLSCLGKDEQRLILDLSEDFLHCPTLKYRFLFKEALSQISSVEIENVTSIFLIPLLSPREFGQTKSSVEALYSFQYSVLRKIEPFKNKSSFSYTSPLLIRQEHSARKNSLIIYFDDFIGSGETVLNALNFYEWNLKNDTDKVVIVSLVAQENGLQNISQAGYTCYSAIKRNRCISDSEKFENKFKTIRAIRKIENRMKVKKDYRLGYKRTQALVSMIRSPNNTLPIYWQRRTPDGEKWDGIFTR